MSELYASIEINKEFTIAIDYLSKTANLVDWAGFFKTKLNERKNICKFKTMLNTEITSLITVSHTSPNKATLTICSKLSPMKRETATIFIEKKDGCTINLSFKTNSPKPEHDPHTSKLKAQIDRDLITLKQTLEDTDA